MATNKELEQQLATLRAELERRGIIEPGARPVLPAELPDFIPFGSEKHMHFLGLTTVGDPEDAKASGYAVYTSTSTGTMYRLVDEMQAVQMYRPMDPDKAILLVLRQKVGAFESGAPKVPAGAPPLFGRGPNESIVEIQGE